MYRICYLDWNSNYGSNMSIIFLKCPNAIRENHVTTFYNTYYIGILRYPMQAPFRFAPFEYLQVVIITYRF